MAKQTAPPPLRIHRLEAENFRRLRAVQIDPDGAVIPVTGRNGHGKSSVLDAIAFGIGGGKLRLADVVHHGAKVATVKLDLGVFKVERSLTAGGKNSIKVTAGEGVRVKSPQAVLDSLVGPYSFDPLAFLGLPPRDLSRRMAALVGIDVDAHNGALQVEEERRRVVRAEVATYEHQVRLCPAPPPPYTGPTPAELRKRREAADAEEAAHRKAQAAADRAASDMDALRGRIGGVDAEIKRLREVRAKTVTDFRAAKAIADLPIPPAPSADLQRQIVDDLNAFAAHEERARIGETRAMYAQQLAEARDVLGQVEERILAMRQSLVEAVAAAKFPVPGLGFGDDGGLMLNGHPFEVASQAEKLRAAVAMGFAANPRLKVLLVRDGSLLDKDSLRLLAELSAENGGQVWLEVVGEQAGPGGILIEEGCVLERDESPTPAEPTPAEPTPAGEASTKAIPQRLRNERIVTEETSTLRAWVQEIQHADRMSRADSEQLSRLNAELDRRGRQQPEQPYEDLDEPCGPEDLYGGDERHDKEDPTYEDDPTCPTCGEARDMCSCEDDGNDYDEVYDLD